MAKKSELTIEDKHYSAFLKAAQSKIVSTRISMAKAACKAQIELYWWFGEQIVKAQEQHGWGRSVVEQLAVDIKKSFKGTTKGFSPQNLWYMRQFYLEYKDYPNLQQVVGEIPWGQNLLILAQVKDYQAREYYLKSTRDMGWTRNVLEVQIKSQAYERHILEKKDHNFQAALPVHLAEQADKAMKSVYMLDTLGLTQPVLEAQLEESMVGKIKEVMLELGYGFAFIGNQYRIVAPGGTENFIDLLFYNRRLQCLIAIELKTGKFKPEYAGKMNYYLNLLDDFVKEQWENPSIGIILCTSKNHVDVEYALRGVDKPVGVSEFTLSRSLPKALRDKLPDAKEIEKEILRQMDKPDETV
ncbi:MAG: hypothetical protein COV52_02230 [Gammaproteobacteria bacterium CG11_big_fil_rev_8_21_14_0_20_46_22]|nr:MAG: hypothetical protein COW05_01220 [Gammaproteobacteria bacterium CG12_big_fil_rev_8_21_14_0_65_46_12]PIR11750.1 MAG: hypothetical protein COV52_02230 [Gammaproteobacteria bacterium CG11_big_fil_rev_8_21_14_0_20_46_22]